MRGQAYGYGDYFGGDAATSQQYCEGGRQMLIFAVLMDASGVTNEAGPESDGNNGKSILVINKSAHQLPLAKFKFSMKKGGFPRNTRATGSVAFRNPRPSKPRFPHKSRNPRQIPKPASTQAVTIRNPPNIPKPASKPAAQVQGNVSTRTQGNTRATGSVTFPNPRHIPKAASKPAAQVQGNVSTRTRACAHTRSLRRTLQVPDGDGYEVHLREVPADGDCFYHCMVGGDVARAKSVQHLKKVFADSLTQEDFAAMQRAADAQLEEFAWFHEKRIEDLQGLKAYAQQIGIHGMWADELAVARIGKYMDVCLLIYKNCAKRNSRFVQKMGNPQATQCMILYLDGTPHYRPVSVNGTTFVPIDEMWPKALDMWPSKATSEAGTKSQSQGGAAGSSSKFVNALGCVWR
jgi:hypothetical protein